MSTVTTASGSAAVRPRRVIVADDTADIRLLLQTAMARRTDVELVGQATNGREAVDLVAALRPDLLVLDIAMPVLSGLHALPLIRAASPETRVVMLTAVDTADHREQARTAGAVAYLSKTTSVRVLVDELLRAADLLDTVLEGAAAPTHRGTAQDEYTPRAARRYVSDTLAAWDEDDVGHTVQLLVSEVVTNSVEHTDRAPEVTIRLTNEFVHVEVFDADPTPPVRREAGVDDNSGRGLAFLDAFASAWGATPFGDGKIVWFDVRRTRPGNRP